MKSVACAVLIASLIGCAGTAEQVVADELPSAEAWLEKVPPTVSNWKEWVSVPEGNFFEVPASKLSTAEYWLKDKQYKALEQSGVEYFGRTDFSCQAPTTPYLLRAAYVNGGTGDFSLRWAGSSIVVLHQALGGGGSPYRSALVSCLERAPSAVYSSISGAL